MNPVAELLFVWSCSQQHRGHHSPSRLVETGEPWQQGDMSAEAPPVKPGSCDVALALSITKWVHINAGDEGLRRFFAALQAALVPGGLLVLEPQPWRSYKQALRKQVPPPGLHRLHPLVCTRPCSRGQLRRPARCRIAC